MLATRSQMSLEFMLIFSGIFIVFVVLFGIYFDKVSQSYEEENEFAAKKIVHDLGYGINGVFVSGTGTNLSVLVPELLPRNTLYTLTVINNSLWINWSSSSYSFPLLTSNMNFSESETGIYQLFHSGSEVIVS